MSRRKPVRFAGGISNMGASLIGGEVCNDGACFAGCRRKPILFSDRGLAATSRFLQTLTAKTMLWQAKLAVRALTLRAKKLAVRQRPQRRWRLFFWD